RSPAGRSTTRTGSTPSSSRSPDPRTPDPGPRGPAPAAVSAAGSAQVGEPAQEQPGTEAGGPLRDLVARLGRAAGAGDVEMRPGDVSREVLEEEGRRDRAAHDVRVARLVGDVRDVGGLAESVGLDERQAPHPLPAHL